MNLAGYQVPAATAAVAGVAALWLLTLLAGVVSWEKPKGKFRRTDLFVFAMSVLAGGIWMFALMPRSSAAPAAVTEARAAKGTCALIEPGETEANVKARLGDPDEIRSEEETRGPKSSVWIYRDSRCAIHFFGSTVESIE